MISKLPRWVEVGGFCLSCIAGATNAVALLGFKHQAVSHLTGTSTSLGVSLADLRFADGGYLLGLILSFVFGAIAAGAIVGNVTLQLGRRYTIALLVESLLLFGAMAVLLQDSTFGLYLASAACGLQNGMVSTYSGAVVRPRMYQACSPILERCWGHRYEAIRSTPVKRSCIWCSLLGSFSEAVSARSFSRTFSSMLCYSQHSGRWHWQQSIGYSG